MDLKVAQLAQPSLESGFNNFSERERRVINHIASRIHATRDGNHALAERHALSDRQADRVARFGGSWTFIMIFATAPVAAVALNTTTLPRYFEAFDPFPYLSLTLILSMVAALLAPIILISQTRRPMRASPDSTMRSTSRPKLNSRLLQEKLSRIRVGPLEEPIGG